MVSTCGAKTRSGEPCKNGAMGNGRCRMHGGMSTGAPKGNKNAVKTGEFETIWVDALDDIERELFDRIDTDALFQIDQEIRLLDIRERRMLMRIKDIQEGKTTLFRYEDKADAIHRIEEALTRIQERKAKYLELINKLDPSEETEDDDGFMDALKGRASEVWQRDAENIEEDEEE